MLNSRQRRERGTGIEVNAFTATGMSCFTKLMTLFIHCKDTARPMRVDYTWTAFFHAQGNGGHEHVGTSRRLYESKPEPKAAFSFICARSR